MFNSMREAFINIGAFALILALIWLACYLSQFIRAWLR